MKKLFLFLSLLVGALACAQSPQLPLGNPSHATTDAKNADNYLLITSGYALSFNSTKGEPNWASWTLRKSDVGSAPRQNDFHAEPALPADFQHVTPSDYDGSGYDRGHLCDSDDRTRSIAANQATFSMANMVPQTKELNEQLWKRFEDYSRVLARQHTLAIVTGCYGSRGHIGHAREINVPLRCWKVVVDESGGTLAVDMPNAHNVAHDPWQKYTTTIADVEKITGFHFALPAHTHALPVPPSK